MYNCCLITAYLALCFYSPFLPKEAYNRFLISILKQDPFMDIATAAMSTATLRHRKIYFSGIDLDIITLRCVKIPSHAADALRPWQ